VDDRAEWAHARKVRRMARLSWPVMVGALVLVLGPTRLEGLAKGLTLALMLGAVAALNLPSWEVVRRARREGAPEGLVRALVATLGMRVGAAALIAALLW
jgi:hypothetical protein